mmetsp:Transcript_10948/g.31401  ORF Transcript_10948/g.31401 Transcript_10948/m.31401 type:complete len:180 (+) Transcript_10948:50-589(+)
MIGGRPAPQSFADSAGSPRGTIHRVPSIRFAKKTPDRTASVRSLIPLTANQQAAAAVVDTVSKRQQLEDARNLENLKAIKSQLAQGIPFLKHNRKGKVKKRIFKSVDLEASLVRWEALPGEPERSVLASSDRPRRVRDIIMIQRGFEQDPAKPEYGGTKTLRRSAGKKAIFKSFSLHFF